MASSATQTGRPLSQRMQAGFEAVLPTLRHLARRSGIPLPPHLHFASFREWVLHPSVVESIHELCLHRLAVAQAIVDGLGGLANIGGSFLSGKALLCDKLLTEDDVPVADFEFNFGS